MEIPTIKYYTIIYPGSQDQHVQETWSEKQILHWYGEHVRKTNAKATDQEIIDQWIMVHHATETDQYGNDS